MTARPSLSTCCPIFPAPHTLETMHSSYPSSYPSYPPLYNPHVSTCELDNHVLCTFMKSSTVGCTCPQAASVGTGVHIITLVPHEHHGTLHCPWVMSGYIAAGVPCWHMLTATQMSCSFCPTISVAVAEISRKPWLQGPVLNFFGIVMLNYSYEMFE